MKPFADAVRGLVFLFQSQTNARVHALATALTMGLATVLELPLSDWRWLAAAIGWVWIAEALNTGVECLGDAVSREHHEGIRRAKDVAAGGVLVAALCAAGIGASIFGPPLAAFFS